MSRGGPEIYCPYCQEFHKCKAISPTKIGEPKNQQCEHFAHNDVSWFRRGRLCSACHGTFLTAEVEDGVLVELFELREHLIEENSRIAERVRHQSSWFVRTEIISKEMAEEFIEESAWWHSHSSGIPMRAPGQKKHIIRTGHGWSIGYGANTFLIGTAIERCGKEINNYFELTDNDSMLDLNELIEELKLHIRGAVANYNGHEYRDYYSVDNDHMRFGTHSINLNDAVSFLIRDSGIDNLLN